jgi:hypothetical protein
MPPTICNEDYTELLSKLEGIASSVASSNSISAELTNAVALLTQRLDDEVIPIVKEHQRILRGNNGNIGLVAVVASIQQTIRDDHVLLHGNDKDDPGLKGEVLRLNRSAGLFGKFVWIVVGATMGTFISVLITLSLSGLGQ